MGKKKNFQKKMNQQNDFIFKKIETQNESIQYMIEALLECYAANYMIMHILLGKIGHKVS